MPDPKFFSRQGPFSLQVIAEQTQSDILNYDGDPSSLMIEDFLPLGQASEKHVSFLTNTKYLEDFKTSKAGACFIAGSLSDKAPKGMACLVSKNPHKAYAIAVSMFYPDDRQGGVHSSAVVDETAQIGKGTSIGVNSVIGAGVEIGENCVIDANVTISHSVIGDHVRVGPGTRIGQAGFGYAMDPSGHVPVPQLGRVVIGNHVEIGANNTIDRGSWKDTKIGDGCVIDNLVQIAHNVELGRGCVIVSQTGISGSTVLGDFVVTGGQAGLAGHLNIGTGTKIGAQAGVLKNIPAGQEYSGTPAVPVRQWLKQSIVLGKLATQKNKKK